jgi:hypothetical protein
MRSVRTRRRVMHELGMAGEVRVVNRLFRLAA